MSLDGLGVIPEEARQFQGDRAGIVTRVLANAVDFSLVVIVSIGSYVGWIAIRYLANPSGFTLTAPTLLAGLVVVWAYQLAYFTIAWATTGRTYGDHLMGLRVVNFRGARLRWAGAALRAGFCTAIPIGLLWVIVSHQNRSIQDIVLRTSVIHDWGNKSVMT
jgi:uncharacterized RDD family membrane protein YckC